MPNRDRPRARRTGGGPFWDERCELLDQSGDPQPNYADLLMALDDAMLDLRAAISRRDQAVGWQSYNKARRITGVLPAGATWRQRRALKELRSALKAFRRR